MSDTYTAITFTTLPGVFGNSAAKVGEAVRAVTGQDDVTLVPQAHDHGDWGGAAHFLLQLPRDRADALADAARALEKASASFGLVRLRTADGTTVSVPPAPAPAHALRHRP